MSISYLEAIAILTFPHYNFTRYPDGEMKPGDYTEDTGIVRVTPDIIENLMLMINLLKLSVE
jgi:hypothetical protein